ncbi:recombinase family protein [Streptomyces sp. NPDC001982]|uniref:recombinase family protein n=1 Tax=Streptomyces sp. NPDC001982 TaxID=3154405 RepID=UPI0033172303
MRAAVLNPEETLRAAVMERVSTAEQLQGYGLEVQDEACRVYVSGKGWRLHDVYKDEGESGSLNLSR